jgi:hypothetical protein
MAIKAIHLDNRVLKTPTTGGELKNLQSTTNLKEYIESIISAQPTEFFADGTAAAPSITFQGDSDTGIYLGGNNILGFAVNGTRTFDIRSSQVSVPAGVTFLTDTIGEITPASGVTIDGLLIKDGGVSNTALSIFAGFYFNTASNNITAGTGGAISVGNYLTTINTDAGGDAFTLSTGTQIGQMKKILLVTDGGGDGVLTAAFAGGSTTATFNDAGDYLILMWNGTTWRVLEANGVTIS